MGQESAHSKFTEHNQNSYARAIWSTKQTVERRCAVPQRNFPVLRFGRIPIRKNYMPATKRDFCECMVTFSHMGQLLNVPVNEWEGSPRGFLDQGGTLVKTSPGLLLLAILLTAVEDAKAWAWRQGRRGLAAASEDSARCFDIAVQLISAWIVRHPQRCSMPLGPRAKAKESTLRAPLHIKGEQATGDQQRVCSPVSGMRETSPTATT